MVKKKLTILPYTVCMCVCLQVMKYFSYFKKQVHKVAFTDSVHSLDAQQVSPEIRRWLTEVCDYVLHCTPVV